MHDAYYVDACLYYDGRLFRPQHMVVVEWPNEERRVSGVILMINSSDVWVIGLGERAIKTRVAISKLARGTILLRSAQGRSDHA